MQKLPTVRVLYNQWGNFVCYIGKTRTMETDEEWKAQQWLNDQALQGAKVSDNSYLQIPSK